MKENLKLELTNPCHENWDAMTASEQGRYCGSCRKTVVDFTTMTDREIISYISLYSNGNTCARVLDVQLNRLIQTPPERKTSWKYFWSLALASLLVTYRSVAQQVKAPKGKEVCLPAGIKGQPSAGPVIRIGGVSASHASPPIQYELSGRVVDEDGHPVSYATVMLKDGQAIVSADVEGYYKISTTQADAFALSISSVGYAPIKQDTMNPKQIKSIEVLKNSIKMEMGDFVMKQQKMGEVVVIARPTKELCGYVGGIDVTRKYTVYQKAKRAVASVVSLKSINSNVFKGDIKVYPNPAPAAGTFTMQFNIKQPGEYNVQFIDAAGRIVGGKQIMIASTGQIETFEGNHLPGHGMYFVRVAGKNNAKIYNAKLLVQ